MVLKQFVRKCFLRSFFDVSRIYDLEKTKIWHVIKTRALYPICV
jgi:hypothetical protein